MHQAGRTPVFFFRSQSPLNPFEALSNYLSFRKLQSSTSTEPLFISESGHVATCFWFHHHLRQVLSLSGLSPIHYSGHSFRIGAATSASRNGVPEHLIQILGRWSSPSLPQIYPLQPQRSSIRPNVFFCRGTRVGGPSCPGAMADFPSSKLPHTATALKIHDQHILISFIVN